MDNSKYTLIQSLIDKGIKNKSVLRAIRDIPREYFLDDNLKSRAYEDNALPIDCHQTISQPYTVAFMTELLEIEKTHKVLEIGTGSGYQALILYSITKNVYSIERIKYLYEKATETFRYFNANIFCKLADGTLGWEEEAPFDRIIVTAGAPKLPEILILQLSVGGIMVVPVGDKETQNMIKLIKTSINKYEIENYNKFRFVPLIGDDGW